MSKDLTVIYLSYKTFVRRGGPENFGLSSQELRRAMKPVVERSRERMRGGFAFMYGRGF